MTVRCAVDLLMHMVFVFGFLGAGAWLLRQGHRTAGGWCIAAAIVTLIFWSNEKQCVSPDEALKWAERDRIAAETKKLKEHQP